MIRATTNGVLKGYRANLNRSTLALNKARDAVLSYRNYNSYAEDPAAAAQSFQLRRSYLRTSSQYSVSSSVLSKFETAYQAMDKIVGLVDNEQEDSAWAAVLRGANGPTGSGRTALGQDLLQLSESIVQAANGARYGDNFLFSGADGLNVPFEWQGEGEDRKLYYRGVPVDTMLNGVNLPAVETDGVGAPKPVDENGNPDPAGTYYLLNDGSGDVISQDDYQKLQQQQQDNALALKQLSYFTTEGKYADIGLGLQENNQGELITSSAYNIALQGINFLGYGVDADGDPKNIASILQRMGHLLQNCTEDGSWANPDSDGEEYTRLAGKLKDASDQLKSAHVKLTAQATFLKGNHEQLKDTANNLNEQFLDLDQVDMADAITSFAWAQYCYNAALKMGNSILSQSLMDYMN